MVIGLEGWQTGGCKRHGVPFWALCGEGGRWEAPAAGLREGVQIEGRREDVGTRGKHHRGERGGKSKKANKVERPETCHVCHS